MKVALKLVFALLFMVMFCFLSGCGSTAETKENSGTSSVVPQELWGRWLWVGSGSSCNLNSKTTTHFTKVDNNLIYKTKSNGVKEYLIRSGCRNTKVNGTVRFKNSLYSKTKGLGNMGNIEAIIENLDDRTVRGNAPVDSQGDFTFDDVPSGEYDVKILDPADQTTVVLPDVSVSGNETNVGTVVLNKSSAHFNLKLAWTVEQNFLFMGRTYHGKLSVKNIGTQIASGLSYKITTDDPFIEHIGFDAANAVGSVDGGDTKTIPLALTFGSQSNPLGRERVTLTIAVTDAYGYEWKEFIDITVYERPLSLNINCNKAWVKGYLIIPGHDLIKVSLNDSTIEIPYVPDDDFYLALSNTNTSSETAYSLGFDKSVSEATDFTDTNAYEPNNSEAEAVTITLNSSLTSFLHAGDIDFYKFVSGHLPELAVTGAHYARVNTPVSFNLAANDEDSNISSMFIDFGDGSNPIPVWGMTTSHSYSIPGTFIVTLWTYDSITGKKVDTKTLITISSDGDITFENGMAFNKIEAGSFLMGSPNTESGRSSGEIQHTVQLTKNFYIMTTEVTQAQWKDAMGSLPEKISTECLSCPVVYVTWNDVMNFIQALETKYGVDFDLPTEAEWEYSARSGTLAAYFTGDISNIYKDMNLDIAGWYFGNSGETIHEVARKKASPWGLYDMHGNVSEWCFDHTRTYTTASVTDPMGATDSKYKSSRGGSYLDNAKDCRAARKQYGVATVAYKDQGFRLVLRP